MASEFDAEFAESAVPELMDQFGEADSVFQHPRGDLALASRKTITAIVQYLDPDRHTEHGSEVLQKAKLKVLESASCDLKDVWTIDGTRYQTETIRPTESGLKVITVRAVAIEHRKDGNANLL